ncbi:unnamed protein product, partial [Prunus brigantina]
MYSDSGFSPPYASLSLVADVDAPPPSVRCGENEPIRYWIMLFSPAVTNSCINGEDEWTWRFVNLVEFDFSTVLS